MIEKRSFAFCAEKEAVLDCESSASILGPLSAPALIYIIYIYIYIYIYMHVGHFLSLTWKRELKELRLH